ncbi:uncharacterized protein LOC115728992 [Rhodamnia argentea]|uniref:Uncharacterized protein LOC115728992 n=1 Tax=Rhodamnia argentea TaxID=178133 RepID=A0A8B8MYT1_9MYRT|nr:uncharacterized protein LOC115728992 [Rhodamnia argentea]XP_048132930.1 uncharacterized protein LOC115728992 [Rhodamnia argentea]
MADFSCLSDTDDSAVEDLISQTKDLCVLEQIAAINCSSFSANDSLLPSDLESRFRKLKSFPLSKPQTTLQSSSNRKTELTLDGQTRPKPDAKPEDLLGNGRDSLGSDSGNSTAEDAIFSPLKGNPEEKSPRESTTKHDPVYSPTYHYDRWKKSKSKSKSPSPSPPRKVGCFWCSPKKPTPRKRDESRAIEKGMSRSFKWMEEDEVLSDLGVFSTKEQKKLLKKAMKEEERISREAEKIARMARQASARMMNASRTGGNSSDDD